MKRTLIGVGVLAAAVVLSGCYGTPTDHSTVVPTVCTKTVATIPPGGSISDIVWTFTPLPDESLTVDVHAPDWSDVPSTFPFSYTVSGFTAPGLTTGDEVDVTLLANDGLWADPNAPAITDLNSDPNTVALDSVLFSNPLPATPGGQLSFGSSVGGPYPVHFVENGGLANGPVVVKFDGLSVFGPLVTLPDGSESVTSVACGPTHPGQLDPAIITITPHTTG